jgi:hypothetical protein
LAHGDAADAADCWFRNITDLRWINDDGTISEQALKGRAIAPAPPQMPWAYEMSGRLLSLVVDVEADGRSFVEVIRTKQKKPSKTLQFAGVAHASVGQLGWETSSKLQTCTYHTPVDFPVEFADPAHSDFTVTGPVEESDLDEIRTKLQAVLKVLGAGNCNSLRATYLKVAPSTTLSSTNNVTSSSNGMSAMRTTYKPN